MWKCVNTEYGQALISVEFSNCGYSFAFISCVNGIPSDCRAWKQDCTAEDFMVFVQTYNPNLDAEFDALIERLESIVIGSHGSPVFSISGDDASEERTVSITANIGSTAAFKFLWKFECLLMDSAELCKVFLQPLFSLVSTLNYQCEVLEVIVERKDLEIQEHRNNGSVIKRDHLETRSFNKQTFMRDSLKTEDARRCLQRPVEAAFISNRVESLCQILVEQSSEQHAAKAKADLVQKPMEHSPKTPTSTPVKAVIEAPTGDDNILSCDTEAQRRAEITMKQSQRDDSKKRKLKLKSLF